MTVEDLSYILLVSIFLIFQEFPGTWAEDCGNNIHCFHPYECCSSQQSCCYDRDAQNDFRHAYKLHVWNMWYFWFIVIFILMSCFGGCGYYRRRRIATMQQQRLSIMTRGGNSRRRDRNTPSYLAYVGPAASEPPEISFLPPPYSEVVSQPGMYPGNKTDLPPYPGPPVISSNYAGDIPSPVAFDSQDGTRETGILPKPPPYTEFVEQAHHPETPLAEESANQNVAVQTPSASRSEESTQPARSQEN